MYMVSALRLKPVGIPRVEVMPNRELKAAVVSVMLIFTFEIVVVLFPSLTLKL